MHVAKGLNSLVLGEL
ncbi:hypothetical protein FD728_01120 [Pantoea sp. Aalb]|nr:hypothetical protein [Pantoea sp. Aalb]